MNDKKKDLKNWITVQAYKHDGSMHRQWSPGYLLKETDDAYFVCSRSSLITEFDGRRWLTKENAVFVLFKKEWLNVICMFKETGGICYYANIATPTLMDDGILRYIDYDLDLKLYPDKSIKLLDEQEFEENIKSYGYSPELVKVVRHSFAKTRKMMEEGVFPFDDKTIEEAYAAFLADTIPFVPKENFSKH